jgi:hypothetical protein
VGDVLAAGVSPSCGVDAQLPIASFTSDSTRSPNLEHLFDTWDVARPIVIAELIGVLADLHAWGRRADDGVWWALVSWDVYARVPAGYNGHVTCSGWTLADRVRRSRTVYSSDHYSCVPRLVLGADPAAWPAPVTGAGRCGHYFGPLSGAPPALSGVTAVSADYPPPR